MVGSLAVMTAAGASWLALGGAASVMAIGAVYVARCPSSAPVGRWWGRYAHAPWVMMLAGGAVNTIYIECDGIIEQDVRLGLAERLDHEAGVDVLAPERSMMSEPAVIVAIISSGASSLVALVTALLSVASQRRAATAVQRIVLKAHDGTSIDIPTGLSDEEVTTWIERAKSMNVAAVRLVLPP